MISLPSTKNTTGCRGIFILDLSVQRADLLFFPAQLRTLLGFQLDVPLLQMPHFCFERLDLRGLHFKYRMDFLVRGRLSRYQHRTSPGREEIILSEQQSSWLFCISSVAALLWVQRHQGAWGHQTEPHTLKSYSPYGAFFSIVLVTGNEGRPFLRQYHRR